MIIRPPVSRPTPPPSVPRIIDPERFLLLAGLVDWQIIRQRYLQSPRAQQIANGRGLSTRARLLQLRWVVDPSLGYPTEPFKVWRRPAILMAAEQKVDPTVFETPFGFRVITWDDPQIFVRARVQVSGSNGAIYAFAGAPMTSALVDAQSVGVGFRTVTFRGPAIQCLVVTLNVQLESISAIGVNNAASDPSWQLVEVVGLPTTADWTGVFDLNAPQGPVGNLMSPVEAALDRFRRGAPFYGWEAEMEPGMAAPPWELANPAAMIDTFHQGLLDPLRAMILSRPPQQHVTYTLEQEMAAAGGSNPARTRFSPLQTLMVGAATDPLTSLISGFGTAIEDSEDDIDRIVLSDNWVFFGDDSRSDWDYMVTAHYGRGADGQSNPVEYAAIAFAPGLATAPPFPTNLRAATDGNRVSDQIDRPWRGIVRLTWDKMPNLLPFLVGSYAAARKPQNPLGNAVPLMQPRPSDTAFQPISATTSQAQEAIGIQALDETYSIASTPVPNSLRYGVAHQNLFGLWSRWTTIGHTIQEPAVQHAPILSARLEVTPPASGSVCPATLVVDLEWDWTVRSLQHIILVGRLYPQAKRNQPPGNLSVPGGLALSLTGGAGVPFVIQFGGNAAGTPPANGSLAYLTADGRNFVAVPPTPQAPRRYRLTISGLSLDFGTTGHIGLALWARGREHRAPQRLGPWTVRPYVVSASDPRPPVPSVQPEHVLLTSLADAYGEHQARLTWSAMSGAVGYFIYTTTETKLRSDRALPDPSLDQTLTERLAALRNAFEADPSRRSFTRLNSTPLTTTETAITIPRGSKEIHLYLVLGVSAGQVESPWPDLSDPERRNRFAAYAAPQIAVPSPPTLEVRRVAEESLSPPVFEAALRIQSRPGATVTRIDLHRVRVPEASLSLDTMGPAIASITGSVAPWTVTATPGSEPGVAQPLGTLTGRDRPTGSWERVFYRAVAWSGDDLARGLYGGRSQPSPAQSVVIPPATPPDLSALTYELGAIATEVVITATSTAPVAETPLGHHWIKVDVRARRADQSYSQVFQYPALTAGTLAENALAAVATSPPPPGENGVWRSPIPNSTASRYRILIRREALTDALTVTLQLIDPLGRVSEQTLTVPAGFLLPAPEIRSPQVTPVPGKGFLFRFQAPVPFEVTPLGPYLLWVGFQASPVIIVRPPSPDSFRLPPGRDPAVGVTVPLNKIRRFRTVDDLFNVPDPIPVQRDRSVRGVTEILIALKGKGGRLTVELESPDGRTARHGRRLQ
ncbi:MAG: hypothetical protein VKK04_24200 [Synechococcales bacterium]|nr:hypothetical protein [Synechococcales bacterium]